MSRWMSVFVAAVIAMSFAVSVQAQCGKGGTTGSMAGMKKDISTCPVMSKLNLTDEQKVKVQAICDKCNEAGGTQEACDQMMKEMETVLTPEQLTQFKAACEEMKAKGKCGPKAGKSGCPMKQSEKSVEEPK
jgi:Spy/CpxP family protein refolding chaperone